MATNPYVESEKSSHPAPASGTRSRITWFTMGVTVSWFFWALISYTGDRPRDHTQSWSEDMQQLAPEWVKNSRGQTLGRFTVIADADRSHAAAIIYPKPNHYPGVIYGDENSDGLVDNLSVIDANHRNWSFTDEDADGRFDSYTYSAGLATESIAFLDADIDGAYDHRFGPGREFAVMIDSDWHDVIIVGKKRYVDVNGEMTEITRVDGTWKTVE